uniref:Uncharacterized protein n=1 Tax=Eutreptiella gymnastica TaxID=73025 RepID=A0A6T2AR75_9EUGL
MKGPVIDVPEVGVQQLAHQLVSCAKALRTSSQDAIVETLKQYLPCSKKAARPAKEDSSMPFPNTNRGADPMPQHLTGYGIPQASDIMSKLLAAHLTKPSACTAPSQVTGLAALLLAGTSSLSTAAPLEQVLVVVRQYRGAMASSRASSNLTRPKLIRASAVTLTKLLDLPTMVVGPKSSVASDADRNSCSEAAKSHSAGMASKEHPTEAKTQMAYGPLTPCGVRKGEIQRISKAEEEARVINYNNETAQRSNLWRSFLSYRNPEPVIPEQGPCKTAGVDPLICSRWTVHSPYSFHGPSEILVPASPTKQDFQGKTSDPLTRWSDMRFADSASFTQSPLECLDDASCKQHSPSYSGRQRRPPRAVDPNGSSTNEISTLFPGECYRQDIQQSTWRAYSSTPASPAPTVPASAATALETKGSFQALQNVKEEKAAGATTGSQPSKATLAVPEARSASNPSKNGSAVPPALGNSLEDVGGSNPDAPVSASDGKMAATTVSEASNMDDGTAENGSKHPTQATCTHAKHWKRLRAKRGSAYFLCFQCGAKWRTCSQAMRAQQEANESAENSDRSDPEIPVAAPSPAFTP